MALLAALALTTLLASSASRMRAMAVAFLAVSLSATALAADSSTRSQVAVIGVSGIVAAGILFVAARDGRYGEDPGWRLWAGTLIATVATPAAFVSFRTVTGDSGDLSLVAAGGAPVLQAAAFWLLSSGIAVLVTARRAVRTSLGALLMLTGVQLLMRSVGAPPLVLTVALAWLEAVVALAGAFLVINERALRE